MTRSKKSETASNANGGSNTNNNNSLTKFKIITKEISRHAEKLEEYLEDILLRPNLKAVLEELGENLQESFFSLPEDKSEQLYERFAHYQDILLSIRDKIEIATMSADQEKSKRESMSTQDSVSKQNPQFLKLPRIDLPSFYGDFPAWLSFKEVFSSTIGSNEQLSDIMKLQYLLSTLKGSAAKLVKGFSITSTNYQNVWSTLCDRYDDCKELTFAHLEKIFSIKPLKTINSKTLLDVVDTCKEALRNLKTLNFERNNFVDIILIYYLQSKLDQDLRQKWELTIDAKTIPNFDDFIKFLEKQSRGLKNTEVTKDSSKIEQKPIKRAIVNNSVVKSNNFNSSVNCILCNGNHKLFLCDQFKGLKVQERWKFVKNQRLCSNCLRPGHYSKECRITARCKCCQAAHHSVLHNFVDTNNSYKSQDNSTKVFENQQNACVQPLVQNSNMKESQSKCLSISISENVPTLLSTALIKVHNSNNQFVVCRALIDQGSQKSLISQDCCRKLKLGVQNTRHRIMGINDQLTETSLAETQINFTPHFNSEMFSIHALVVTRVTSDLPNFAIQSNSWPHLKNLVLADPSFHKTSPIDILLGADIFSEIMIGNPVIGPTGSPSAIASKLGFLLGGRIFSPPSEKIFTGHTLIDLSEQLHKFWEIEAVPTSCSPSSDDEVCEKIYSTTVSRTETGRYQVKLPFKSDVSLGDTFHNTLKRFNSLENKLFKNQSLNQDYSKFMSEYLELNHMEQVPENSLINPSCYIPHHCILKENNITSRIRVVFDASMKSSTGQSLNDSLFVGPKLQSDLFNILIKFRTFPFAVSADIEKMYRQILISKEDSDFQRILWRLDSQNQITHFRLLTVTYGTACAPYLAIRTLRQLAMDEKPNFPEASERALTDFYVDDLLSGANSIEEAKHLVNQMNELLLSGGFSLRKWCSNAPEVISHLPTDLKSTSDSVHIQEDNSIKILGLKWNAVEDTFKINIQDSNSVNTKRQLLSVIARIFDPLGLLSATTILLKIMMQDLWKDKLPWDDPIPESTQKTWLQFQAEMECLKMIKVPRFIFNTKSHSVNLQLHGFCDASSKAYASALYVRATLKSGEVVVNLVAAKTKVTPIKPITLPRLELSAALLLAELYHHTIKSLTNHFDDIYFWSDSTIALSWIAAKSSKLDPFVSHRVTKINSLAPKVLWNHIHSLENPSDCASRGIMPSKLLNHPLWWSGPPWLSQDISSLNLHIYSASFILPSDIDPTPSILELASQVKPLPVPEFLCKFSSFSKLTRVVAWVYRFIRNSRQISNHHTGPLKVSEIQASTHTIIKCLQHSEFHDDIVALQQQKSLPQKSKLRPLNVFLDDKGLLRVGGRLSKHQSFTEDQKHPMLLPKHHVITQSIIRQFHLTHLHAGTQLVLALLRQQYWIIDGRSTVRHELRKCLTCFKLSSKPETQIMGELPVERISQSRPFSRIGIDYAGPFFIKPNMKRSTTKLKAYLCLIVCLSTKAVHLELVSDATSDALLAALRRFIARRGCPIDIFSDNGTNFKGASKHLRILQTISKSQEVQHFCLTKAITWHFIPPYSPNFGGLWEASIKLAKRHILKSCTSALLNFEEMSTLLCQIEACLNSRPLTPISSDSTDLQALTPGHFIIGAPLLEIPEPSSPPKQLLLSSRWQLIQNVRRHFWTRWSREYLPQLQPRAKWTTSTPDLTIGDMVIVRDIQTPPLQWRLGRVTQLHKGTDGHVRTVILHTSKGEMTRTLSKISKVPFLCTPEPASNAPGGEDVES